MQCKLAVGLHKQLILLKTGSSEEFFINCKTYAGVLFSAGINVCFKNPVGPIHLYFYIQMDSLAKESLLVGVGSENRNRNGCCYRISKIWLMDMGKFKQMQVKRFIRISKQFSNI